MAAPTITAPNLGDRVGPLLPALAPAAVSTQPAESVLPFLSPILRQRVQLLSAASTEPWIRLLCYDTSKVPALLEIAQGGSLEPHPVSGEVEVDWDYDAEIRYRRLDPETFQGLVVLREPSLSFKLVHCTGDPEGDGWKVGEVSVPDQTSPFSSFGGVSSIGEAERQFTDSQTSASTRAPPSNGPVLKTIGIGDEEDDDDYWARYDATPARTPGAQTSPAPGAAQSGTSKTAEDDYYAQYDMVQPAMDNHDPDEEANLPDDLMAPPLGLARKLAAVHNGSSEEEMELNETRGAWTLAEPPKSPSQHSADEREAALLHPRPASSASSNASVKKLEAAAETFGVQQHISRSIKSLFLLGKASGMDREEFERIIKTELDMLGLLDEE